MELKTKRLTVAVLTDEQVRALRDGCKDAEMQAAYGEMLDGALQHPEQRHWYAAWAMLLGEKQIGDLCFKGPPENSMVEIGYGIDSAYEGQGYTTEAAGAMVSWALSQPGVSAVEGETEPDNAASQRVLQKLGFVPCGMGAEGPRFRRCKGTERWRTLLSPADTAAAERLFSRLDSCQEAGIQTYPPRDQIMAAIELTPPEVCSVILLGQDPYHEPGQANGLAFSVEAGNRLPPSLRNIFRELQADLNCEAPKSGDLRGWAEQGVLLLNTVLSVSKGEAFSHGDWGWQYIVARLLLHYAETGTEKVFLVWGQQAVRFLDSVPNLTGCSDTWLQRHTLLCSTHPSPLSASRGTKTLPAFLGSRPFSKCNAVLKEKGLREINWNCVI